MKKQEKTALQQYADWLALRDNTKEVYTVTLSDTAFVAIRKPLPEDTNKK